MGFEVPAVVFGYLFPKLKLASLRSSPLSCRFPLPLLSLFPPTTLRAYEEEEMSGILWRIG
jgi:hypothetical protein